MRVFLAGGVPEVMLHLRQLGLLNGGAVTVAGRTWDDVLDEWEDSERRHRLRERLREQDGVDPDDVICPPARARAKGMTSTVCFPAGNLAPNGSVIKSTALDPSSLDADGVLRMTGRARVFTRERDVIAALKGQDGEPVVEGEVIVLAGRGPLGSGMEETYQVTSFLRYLPAGRGIALVTDARFSGVSTGPCIGHVSPEALEGGPIGKLVDGDLVRIVVDTRQPGGVGRAGRPRRRGVDGGRVGGRAPGTADEPGDPAGRSPAGGHRALGTPAVGQRGPLGRVRLRRRVDRRGAGRCGGHGGGG